jgi:dCMP deaminase
MDKKQIEEYLIKASNFSSSSGCLRAKIGCLIVREEKILVKTCNEVFPQNNYCQQNGCLRDKLKLGLGQFAERCRSIHAEAKAVSEAARKGVSLEEATAFTTCAPCINCAKLLVKAGIKEVYYIDKHGDSAGLKILEISSVKAERVIPPGDDPAQRLRDASGQT